MSKFLNFILDDLTLVKKRENGNVGIYERKLFMDGVLEWLDW